MLPGRKRMFGQNADDDISVSNTWRYVISTHKIQRSIQMGVNQHGEIRPLVEGAHNLDEINYLFQTTRKCRALRWVQPLGDA
jgi:hypothetical protein